MKHQESSTKKISVPVSGNKLLSKVLTKINANEELQALWEINNVNAIERLGYSDHGFTHFQIVANIGLRIARILHKKGVVMSIEKGYALPYDYAEVVIVLASVLHDIGMSINREGHEELSLFIARDLLKDILSDFSVRERTILVSDILHAILSHRSSGSPITVEAGIVRVSDALDMSKGRSRIPFEAGQVNIHSISAYAVEKIEIEEGKEKPIRVEILMNNSSGLFQVDELLKKKLEHSGIQKYFEIRAYTEGPEATIIKEFFV